MQTYYANIFVKLRSGISLISLIIGAGLTAFLIVILLQIFSSSRASYILAENIVQLEETMNFFIATVTDITTHTGHRSPPAATDPFLPLNSAFPGEPNLANALPGRYVMPFISANNKDGFTIAYQGHASGYIKDCHGTVVGVHPEVAYLTFKQVAGSNGGNNLLCERYQSANSTEIIADLLDELWVRYGEDTNNDGQASRYVSASQNPDYSKVRAIQLAVLLRSAQEVHRQDVEFKFVKWGETITKNDKYLYKFMTVTLPFNNLPDPTLTKAQGGTILTDTPALTAALPFSPYKPPNYYFNNSKTYVGNSITHDGSFGTADTAVAYIMPFVDANSVNANKEIYVEYNLYNAGNGDNVYFCYYFPGISSAIPGNGSSAKMCYQHITSQTKWYIYDCSSSEAIIVTDEGALNNGDTIGLSITFPAAVTSGQNIITKLYRNGINIHSYPSNGSSCQAQWDTAINNWEKVVFAVGEFTGTAGIMQFGINKPPLFLPAGAEPLWQ